MDENVNKRQFCWFFICKMEKGRGIDLDKVLIVWLKRLEDGKNKDHRFQLEYPWMLSLLCTWDLRFRMPHGGL